MKFKKLDYTDLKNKCDNTELNFSKTTELEPFCGIIGQERALRAIKTAVDIKEKGFNLYVSGNIGIGKTAYVLSVVNSIAQNEKVPNDYCYIYNFDNPNEPISISLEPGMGIEFKFDMNRFITKLMERLQKDLSGDTYEKEKKNINDRYSKSKEKIMKDFDRYTTEQGFKIRNTENGIYFSPIYNGVILNEQEFSILDEKIKKQFEEKSPKIQEQTLEILKRIDIIDKECANVITEWQTNLVTFAVTQCMSDLKLKYKNNLKIQNFLYSIQSDVVKNIEYFKQYQESLKNPQGQQAQYIAQRADAKPWENYRVNLIIDNDKLEHAPVIICKNPNYFDLFGKLEFESSVTGMRTNYTMLKPGLLHKANGGYIIINIADLLVSMPTWEAFKRVLRNQELTIDSSRDLSQPVTIMSLKPEPIPLNVEVILIGSELNYQQLCNLDVTFKKMFKIKADFDDTYERTPENTMKLARYIAYICKKYNLLAFNCSAVAEIIEYSSRCSNDKNKLTAIMQDIIDVIIESNSVAKNLNKKIVSSNEVEAALKARSKRYSKYGDNLKNMITDGTIMISTDGEKIGQINGLTIISNGDLTFGMPVRITANTFIGKSGILNIEREVLMSGTSHSKGVFILSAYIGEKYAQDIPLSLTASICFEQLYNGVDGDSASSTELYAILSSLSSTPIKQNLAVTGSVNQKGEIQPIGGVSDKIEGFFKICKEHGLDGTHGVLIPHQNVKNLNLDNEIVEAVKNNLFSIYPVSTIDEGIEILTGVKSGKLLKDGNYEKGSINFLVSEKLKKYAEKSLNFKQ
ncbi:MAG: AAA family ATPase [Clostridia bacterium]|nr:AAA family ATPase [Clostridia bacterium]